MKTSKLTAQKLRYVLIIALVLTLGLSIAGFIYVYGLLESYNSKTEALSIKADLNNTNVNNLKKLRDYLNNNRTDIARARSIVAESKLYVYQDDIVKDISRYGDEAGITIDLFSFTQSAPAPGGGAATPPTTPSSTATPTPSQPVAGGVKSTMTNVTIRNPVDYYRLLAFIKRIESSPMKMQIGNISLTRSDNGSVASQAFIIEVYIR